MKSVLSAVRSLADKSRLNESGAAGRDDRTELWGLDAAIPRRIGATTGPGDDRAPDEGGDPEWRARRDGVIVGTEAGSRQAVGDRPRRHGGAGGSGAGDHEESSKAGVGPPTGRSRAVGTRARMTIVPV
jgi:hypothetical protein